MHPLRLFAIPWRTLRVILGAFLLLPLVGILFYLLDLFAKDYDSALPGILGIVALALLTGVFCWYLAWLIQMALAVEAPLGRLIAVALILAPTLAFYLRGLDFVDWLPVYLSAFTLPCLLIFPRRGFASGFRLGLGLLLVLLLTGMTVRSQLPAYRLPRYTQQLQFGCWPCGYKARALHELCSLGGPGRAAIVRHYRVQKESGERQLVMANLPPLDPVRSDIQAISTPWE